MSAIPPAESSQGNNEKQKRVVGNLAVWMRVVAFMGLLGSGAVMLSVLGERQEWLQRLTQLLAGLGGCVFWLFFLQCAAAFRRSAQAQQDGGKSLVAALQREDVPPAVEGLVAARVHVNRPFAWTQRLLARRPGTTLVSKDVHSP